MPLKHVLATLAFLMLPLSALCEPFAYVQNEKSGTISVIDTATDEVVGEIKAGDKPRGAALSADGKWLFVSDQPNNILVKVDTETREVVGKIELGESPEGVSSSPDGKWVAAASEISNSVNFIDATSGKKM
jgi:YVTN family beta-propeller protein